ncbi:MAG: folate-binding protein [Limnobacter sp.]|nr:folate-binding protein [Limnobacter sp.]
MSKNVLSRWGVICVEGEEAAQFLHAQLSNSIKDLPENKIRLAAFCNAKGRMLGTFFVVRKGVQHFLICPSSTIPALTKRLSMFILRSKCKARDASSEWQMQFVPSVSAVLPTAGPMSAHWADDTTCTLALRPHGGVTAGLALKSSSALGDAVPSTTEDDQFDLALHRLGIPFVSIETVEMFIPQAVNFDLIGGVNFEKGCYPGQEIVARSHYLGKSKRRAFSAVVSSEGAIRAGMDVWMEGKTNEPVGNVVTVAHADGNAHLMVDCGLEDAAKPDSQFTLTIDGKALIFKLTNPPYDFTAKGSQFND